MSQTNLTKAERRAAAREKARLMQEAEEKRAKRNKLITIVVIVVAIALVGAAIWSIISNQSEDESTAGRQQWDPVNVSVEPVLKSGTDITTGYAVLGEDAELSENAVRVDIYFDYMCTYCNDLEQFNGGDINDIIAAGAAEFVYHPVAILNNTFSAKGAAAFMYIAENSPEHLMAFHKNVFEDADAFINGRSSTIPDWNNLKEAALDAGVPEDIANSIEAEADLEWAQTATTEFLTEFRGTPTVLLNNQQTNAWAANDFPGLLGLAEPKASQTE